MTEDAKTRHAANTAKIKARLNAETAETRAELERWLERIPESRATLNCSANPTPSC
jgi:hypothetical protein